MTAPALLIPGYTIDPTTGAWCTLPWPGDPTLPYNHPDRLALLPPSLGPHNIAWAHRWLKDPKTGGPWRFTPGQARFIHLWYSLDLEAKRWLYRSGVKRGAKGTGKDPFAAALVILEFAGPVAFDRVVDGVVLGKRRNMALVQLAANSLKQAGQLMRMVNAMMSEELKAALNIDAGLTRTIMPGGSRIEMITASEKSAEGDPPTAVFLNESHHMTHSSGGQATAEVARRNVGKSPADVQARLLELTNAHSPGTDSVAEDSFNEWQAQQTRPPELRDLLYDSVEADPSINPADPQQMRHGLEQAYQDAPWADLDRLLAEALDSRTTPADTIRFYLNGLAANEDVWVDPRNFDDLARPDIVVEEGERIAMFLDCSKSGDATTLSGCRLSDGHIISLGGWRKPHGERGKGWLAPRQMVDAVVREAFEFYDVVWFGVDPSPATDDETEALYWRPMIDSWHRDFQKHLKVWATPGAGGHSVLFDMRLSSSGAVKRNKQFTEAAMQTALDIDEEHTLTHDGHPMLRNHVHNARRRPNQWGVSLGKINRSSSDLVDYAVTMVGARLGRQLALLNPKVKTGRKRGARRVKL
ncbi:terminase [Corynebacterium flavescens]|uniref:terminase n=1 Tax=Corynebacterium flavescens TaxID=28028 RepID=UPI0028A1A575|nr:terminase [Corynebacterium flavescens]